MAQTVLTHPSKPCSGQVTVSAVVLLLSDLLFVLQKFEQLQLLLRLRETVLPLLLDLMLVQLIDC